MEAHAPSAGSPHAAEPPRARARDGQALRGARVRGGMSVSTRRSGQHTTHFDASRQRRMNEQRRAERHTRRVRRLRLALPTASALIVAVLLVSAILPKLLPLSALAGLSLTADGLVMNEPRLAGSLGEGRRYEVVADRAVQSLLSPANLSLEGLHADLDLGAEGTVTIDGKEAAYNTDTEILTLSDGVEIVSSDGNRVRLNDATVFLGEGRVESDGGVTISSPRGTIEAGAIDIENGGELIRLSGGVAITIDPQR